MRAQFSSMGELFKTRTLPVLLLVSGFRGMADRAFVPFLPIYIAAGVRASNPDATLADVGWWTGVYLGALAAGGIVVSPLIGAVSDKIGRRSVMIAVLFVTTGVLALMWWVGSLGVLFGVLVFAYGTVRFAINNLTQAASLDVAEGRRLEGSMIGMLWGNNALFGAFSAMM
jgi:MFS family permease